MATGKGHDGLSVGKGRRPNGILRRGVSADAATAGAAPLRQQASGVGMLPARQHGVGGALLDHAAVLQHHDLVAHEVHHGQVVADEEVRQAESVLQVLHQVEHLGLHADVQRLTGSSATISRGCVTSARAMAMRWRWPPENSCGYLSRSAARRPTASSMPRGALAAVRRRPRALPAPPAARPRCCSTVRRGSSEAYGSWNTIWKSRRALAQRRSQPAHAGRGRPAAPCRPTAAPAPSPGAPACSCPSPTRRPRPGCGRPASVKLTSASASTDSRAAPAGAAAAAG
jgi:hypothetical protein